MFVVRPFQATTLAWWHSERDQLDLSPSYQRSAGVWSIKDKAFLIDSIINGYDIPKFYVADFSYVSSRLNIKNKMYAVIDGRQRFEAIFDFLDGRFGLNSDMRYLGEEPVNLAGMRFNDLKEKYPRIAQRIENFNINVMSVITDNESQINDLFVRLNRSKPLTGAEVRSAMVGKVPEIIRRLADLEFFQSTIAFNKTRKQAENVAAKLLLIEHRGDFVETKKINLDRFAKEAGLTETDFEATATRAEQVLERMAVIFEKSDILLRSSGSIPVYYWFVRNHPNINVRDVIKNFVDYSKSNPTLPAIVDYARGNRSTNDPFSYRVRYMTLVEFVKNNGDLSRISGVKDYL